MSRRSDDTLSERELDPLRRLVAGERPTAIAEALRLSVKTVGTHPSRILYPLQLPNPAALVRCGVGQGLGDSTAGVADPATGADGSGSWAPAGPTAGRAQTGSAPGGAARTAPPTIEWVAWRTGRTKPTAALPESRVRRPRMQPVCHPQYGR